jgi:hypothetical protein
MTESKEIPVVKYALEKEIVKAKYGGYLFKVLGSALVDDLIPRTVVIKEVIIELPVTHYKATQSYKHHKEGKGDANAPFLCSLIAKMPAQRQHSQCQRKQHIRDAIRKRWFHLLLVT